MTVILVEGKTIPEVWEKSLIETWGKGDEFETEYDKPGDPKSKDSIMIMKIEEPFTEPRIHRSFPAGLADLEIYKQEVINGVHDHWINPKEGKWEYTYHKRFFEYDIPGIGDINQIEKVIEKLAEAPHTRRAQAITWKAWEDIGIKDPPCLQRFWFRVYDDKLRMNIHIRSNDAYKAGFMNIYAFTELQKKIAGMLSKKLGREIEVGEYVHIADSYHIYGSYFNEFENGFLKLLKNRSFEERVWTTQFAKPFFREGIERLLRDGAMPANKRELLEKELEKY